jgi:hypothetical protein
MFREITLEALQETPMIVPALSLQEEFAPYASLRGSSPGVVARVESLRGGWGKARGKSRGCLSHC